MTEREKVIRGFECCLRNDHKKCPYYSADIMDTTCYTRLHTDALALLEEQEPRVMTREEVIRSHDWIWYQWKNTHCGWTIAVNCDEKWIEWEDSTTDQLCKYGEKWRCWTSRPTPDQMRETPWEGDNDAE